ncbi:MAG: Dyp-type peroxidase [Actinomycetota bacterium]
MTSLDRRRFMTTAGVAGAAAALTSRIPTAAALDGPAGANIYDFHGAHQAGVTAPLPSAGMVVALDLRSENRDELRTALQDLTASIRTVMTGEGYEDRPGGFPPYDTGILGPVAGATDTAVVVGFGDSMFDDRFGLGDQKPNELQPMMKFGNDYLVRPEGSHGDISITIGANSSDAVVHTLRQILRETRGHFVPKWSKEGFNELNPEAGPDEAPVRNLMGFKDGTANLDSNDPAVMADRVWISPDDGQPDWAVGGTYQVIRVIRMQAEFWDRTRLNEQEAIFGRHRDSGAPLGMRNESDTPEFNGDLESHIARANPRTTGSEKNLILRRGFNYASGFDGNDQLDQGLIFVCYQRSLEDGFITVQRRLDGEVLEEYIRPVAGGFFFVPRPPDEEGFLGDELLA